MVTPRSTSVHLLASSPQTTSRLLLSPTCSPRHQQPPRHRHWLARALSPSPRTTTIRHGHRNARTVTIATGPHFLRHQVPRTRLEVADPSASSPVPRNHRSAIVIDDRLRTPRPRPPAIKGGRPCLNTPHHLAPLPLLALLAPFPLHISHHAAPISHQSSPETRKTKPSISSTSGAAATLPRLAVVDQFVCPPRRPRWTSVSRPSPPSWPPVGLALAGARRR
jgi:hypothetical protein